jgi:hypothetical protein
MSIRLFDWRDIPALQRYRHQCVFFYNSLLLTRGPLFFPGAMLSNFSPATGIVTAVHRKNDQAQLLIGQTYRITGSQSAHLTFLAPQEGLESSALPGLLDYLAVQAGAQGAFRTIAEVEEGTAFLDILRQQGFAVYTRQRVWRVPHQEQGKPSLKWRKAEEVDLLGIHSLLRNVVPALVQQVEPFPYKHPHGMIYRQGGDVLAYADLKTGRKGVWVQPVFHPAVENQDELFSNLLECLPNRSSRPVYLCIRSYLSWLEPALDELGAQASPQQAVMVKHIALAQKATRPVALPALEGGRPEVSTPFARSEKHT